MQDALPPAPPPSHSIRRRNYRLGRWAYGLMGVVVVVVAADYMAHRLNLITPPAQRVSAIQAMPEAALLVPGSQVLLRNTSGPVNLFGLGTVSEAAVSTTAAVNANYEQIFTYFKHQLGPRGWQGPDPDGIDSPHWTKGHYVFSLGWAQPGDPTFPGESAYTPTYTVGIRYSSRTAGPPTTG